MNIKIKKLTPDLAEDYIHFFDVTPHDKYVDEHKCYCVCWCSTDHRIETDYSTAEKRRILATQYINDGIIQGYLAYHENQVVGWCNANTKSDCLYCISWLRFMQSVSDIEIDPNRKVKSVFCFVIAPNMQRKGIATQLLERVCEDAANDGFDYVEAYPRKEFIDVSSDFMGHIKMYKKIGFTETAECDDVVIMRKEITVTEETNEERQSRIYPIILSEYNPAWQEWYAEEKANLEQLIGVENIARISHFGSTAVPGLMAKPTVDILIEISDDTAINKLIASLSTPDYIYLHQESAPTISTPSLHLMFLKGYLSDGFAEKVYHIHVVRPGDWDEKLSFRDYLIAHPEAAAEYAKLKHSLIKDYKHYRDGYTEAKGAFIKEITEKAMKLL